MKSVVLVPFSPWPADTGGKVEMWKHLNVLRDLGPCTILSASTRPVGCGWSAEARREVESRGFKLVLRESDCPRRSWRQWLGMAYGAVCKGLWLEKAFGHSNPYHRYAFPCDWFYRHTREADIAVIIYSYWAHLPSAAPKAVALLDLWSSYMWEGTRREQRDLSACDTVFVISRQEATRMEGWGAPHLVWSPPAVDAPENVPLSADVGLVGSGNAFNREGLKWLERAARRDVKIRIYGGLSKYAGHPSFVPVGSYVDTMQPYRECGIVLFTTALGMGVQIKTIEALAAGRAIVARRGAVRGLPDDAPAWIEVDDPQAMWAEIARLRVDNQARKELSERARQYYHTYLESTSIINELRRRYLYLAGRTE